MKLLTTKKDTLLFHGNCKDSRIRKVLLITKEKPNLVHQLLASRGIYDPDSKNLKRYAKAIRLSRAIKRKRVKVTEL